MVFTAVLNAQVLWEDLHRITMGITMSDATRDAMYSDLIASCIYSSLRLVGRSRSLSSEWIGSHAGCDAYWDEMRLHVASSPAVRDVIQLCHRLQPVRDLRVHMACGTLVVSIYYHDHHQ